MQRDCTARLMHMSIPPRPANRPKQGDSRASGSRRANCPLQGEPPPAARAHNRNFKTVDGYTVDGGASPSVQPLDGRSGSGAFGQWSDGESRLSEAERRAVDVVAMAGHELKGPLTSIRGYAQL